MAGLRTRGIYWKKKKNIQGEKCPNITFLVFVLNMEGFIREVVRVAYPSISKLYPSIGHPHAFFKLSIGKSWYKQTGSAQSPSPSSSHHEAITTRAITNQRFKERFAGTLFSTYFLCMRRFGDISLGHTVHAPESIKMSRHFA